MFYKQFKKIFVYQIKINILIIVIIVRMKNISIIILESLEMKLYTNITLFSDNIFYYNKKFSYHI